MAVAANVSAGVNRTQMQKSIAKFDARTTKVVKASRNGVSPQTATVNFESNILRANRDVNTWDFEDASQFNEFTIIDADGDGYNWTYYNNTGLETGRMTAHDGEGLIASASYDNDSGTALTPDNWLISPEVTLGGALTFWYAGQDANYASEKFAVYVCVGSYAGVESFTKVAGDFTATGDYQELEIDLSAYQGMVGHFAIVHHNVTDMFFLNIDDIKLDPNAVALPYPIVPEVTVTPGATTAAVAWGADEGAEAWNLRYRPFVDTSGNPITAYLPLEGYEAELENWFIYDADGDGYNWGLAYSDNSQTDLCFYSYSWSSASGALSPDNYLISADTKLQGKVSFTLWGNSSNYPEQMQVYAYVYGEGEEDGELVQLFENDLVTTTTHTEYSASLEQFNGALGYIIFRHYGTTDMYAMYVDNIFIGDPDAEIIEPAEWIYVNEIPVNNYTIDGLTPETEYEVQVMGYNESHQSDWSDIVNFFTLADEVPGMRGDVNDDGVVNINDVTALIDAVLGNNWEGLNYDNADCNLDEGVNINDVTTLIDYVLGGVWGE